MALVTQVSVIGIYPFPCQPGTNAPGFLVFHAGLICMGHSASFEILVKIKDCCVYQTASHNCLLLWENGLLHTRISLDFLLFILKHLELFSKLFAALLPLLSASLVVHR